MSRYAHPAGARHAEGADHTTSFPRVPADVNALTPAVWATSVERRADGVLTVGGLDVRDLAAEHGTPAYLLDEADFRWRAGVFREAFGPDVDVFYAGKAFLCTEVARWVEQEGLCLDVSTDGELAVALRAGFPPERLVFHGNNKSVGEIARGLDAGVGRFVLDSFEEIARIASLAQDRGVRARVMVRVTVGVEAHTHEYIATAHEDQKFGFSLAGGQAAEAVRRVLMLPSLELAGLHSHIGSQIFDPSGFEVAARRVIALQAEIREEHGVELPELDLGGGFGIAYTAEDDPEPVKVVASGILDAVRGECERHGLAVPRISVEPGRAIVGPSAFTLYEVGTVKQVDLGGGASRLYVSVDGGMSDNIRPALYDAAYTCLLASRASDAAPVPARVVGKHCESGDIVVHDEYLPADVAPGDLIAVPATGAYCRSMASNYNHVPRPPVVAVGGGSSRVLVRRETEDDLLELDVS